jgi:uroporphyrinogen III methyltransferase/synthase
MKGDMAGKVFLIGGGPGDPGLFTLRGRAILSRADVVVYDFLANEALLEHARPGAEIVFMGKRGGGATRPQADIDALLIARAREGKTVARLKGGDPLLFGRGGEEALALVEAGIPFEIVPGIASALAAPAYAGIPVTHRDLASSVAFVAGHEDPSKGESAIDWARLAPRTGTLVFLMATARLEAIAEALIANGRTAETPAAVIRWGTRPSQRTVSAPLGKIAREARAAGIEPPTVLVVGEVSALRAKLRWFEAKPLFGKRILVTRAREQAGGLVERLREEGAEVIPFPVIAFGDPPDGGPLDRAIGNLAAYDGVLFTSANAVERFFARMDARGLDARALSGRILGAIGPETAAALARHGVRADVVPDAYVAEGLAAALAGRVALAGKRFLLPRARDAREALPEALERAGARCDVVEAYRTVTPEGAGARLGALLGEVDVVTFTSSSTVRNFLSLLPSGQAHALLRGKVVACIGPITARTALDAGIKADIVAPAFTADELARAIVAWHAEERREGT